MYYQMGNFVPWRNAARVLLSERATALSRQCAECATRDGVPEAVSSAATTAATISEQLAGHLPQDLRPAEASWSRIPPADSASAFTESTRSAPPGARPLVVM
jgi:hypothetical protein